MKTMYKGVNFEGTMAEFTNFMKLVDSGVFGGKSNPTTSGRGNATRTKLTEEERAEKQRIKNEEHKAEQKAWFDALTETQQREFLNYKAFGRVLKDAYTLASAKMVGSSLKNEERKAEWSKHYEKNIKSLCKERDLDMSVAKVDYENWKKAHPKKK